MVAPARPALAPHTPAPTTGAPPSVPSATPASLTTPVPSATVLRPNPTASVTPTAPADAQVGYDPINILRAVSDGDITVTLPGIANHYGSGIESFDIKDTKGPNGTRKPMIVTLHARIKDGKVDADPENTYVSVLLDVGTIFKIKITGLELKKEPLWQYTDNHDPAHQVDIIVQKRSDIPAAYRASGKEFVGARIIAKLSHILNFLPFGHHLDITKSKLGVEGLPLALADDGSGKPGLYETLAQHASEIAGKAQKAIGSPFDTSKYTLQVDNCRMRAGPLKLPPGMPTVVLGEGDVMTVTASASAITVKGHFDVPRFYGVAGDSKIDGSSFAADGSVTVSLDAKKHPQEITLQLDRTSGKLLPSHLSDGKGSSVDVAGANLSDASFTVSKKFTGDAPLTISALFALNTKMSNAHFSVQQEGKSIPVRLADTQFNGIIALAPQYLSVEARQMNIAAAANGIVLGKGALRLDTASASVKGSGAFKFVNGAIDIFSDDLKLAAQVASGHLEAGAVSAEIASGTQLHLTVNKVRWGGLVPVFDGKGAFTLTLAGGQLRGPHSVHEIRPGSTATITADHIGVDGTGVTAHGSFTVDTQLDDKGSDAVDVEGVHVAAKGDSETLHAEAHDFALDHGALTIGALAFDAKAIVSRISGKLTAASIVSTTTSLQTPTVTSEAMVKPDISGITKPNNVTIASLVDTADVNAKFTLLPKHHTVLGHDLLFPPTAVTVTIDAKARGGVLVPGGTALHFSPPLTIPRIDGFPTDVAADLVGLSIPDVRLDARGHLMLDLSLRLPHVRLHASWHPSDWVSAKMERVAIDCGESPLALSLTKLVAAATLATASTTPSSGAATSPVYKDVEVTATNVTLKSAIVPIAAGTFLMTTPGTKLSLSLATNGDVSLNGKVVLGASMINVPGFSATNLSGATEATVSIKANGDMEAKLEHLHAHASNLRLQSHTDVISVDNAALKGTVTITAAAGASPHADAVLTDVGGSLVKDASRVFVTIDKHVTGAEFGGGTLEDGVFHYDGTGLNASGTLTDVKGSIESLPIALGAVSFAVKRASIEIPSGKFSVANGALTFSGRINAEADLSGGHFGAPKTAFNLDIGSGTSARFSLDNLVVGNVPKGTRTLKGSGFVVFNLTGGQIRIPDPRGPKFPSSLVSVEPGSAGRIDLDMEATAGQPFGKVRSALQFHGKLHGTLPKAGIASGPLTIRKVESNSEDVQVHVAGLSLENDGRFALDGVTLTEHTETAGIVGTIAPMLLSPSKLSFPNSTTRN